MAIRPPKPGSPRGAKPHGAAKLNGHSPAPLGAPGGGGLEAAGWLEKSAGARQLPADERSDTLPADRLRTLLARLTDGFYDRADVLDVVAQGVAAELGVGA